MQLEVINGRKKLPNRRSIEIIDLEFRNQHFVVQVGYADERDQVPREVFIMARKAGNQLAEDARDVGILISKALEYGCPLEALKNAVCREEDSAPSGLAGAVLDEMVELEGIAHTNGDEDEG